MNAAEKARLAREQQEREKREKKIRFWAKVVKTIEILFILVSVGAIVAITVTSQIKNIPALAVCHRIGIGVIIADAVGAVVAFFMAAKSSDVAKSERLINISVFLLGAIFLLGIVLIGASGMLKK